VVALPPPTHEPFLLDPDLHQRRLAVMAEIARLKHFFVLGRGKSGTTWLSGILRSHPQVFVLGERKLVEKSSDYVPILRHLLDEEVMGAWGKHSSFRLSLQPERMGPELWRLVDDYLTAAALVANDAKIGRLTHLGDKLALLTARDADAILPNLERAYPGYRAVHIVRDGRDVAVSGLFHVYRSRVVVSGEAESLIKTKVERAINRKGSRLFTDHHLTTRAKSWAEVTTAIDDHLRPALGERYLMLRYEDLLADTKGAVDRVFDFVGVDRDQELVERIIDRTSFQSMSGGRQAGQQDLSSGRRKGKAGDWVNHFTRRDRVLFAAAAQPALERFGYEPDAGWTKRR